jgi:hypothetical protein
LTVKASVHFAVDVCFRAFLAERRRVRSLIECAPGGDESPELTERYRQLNAEFDRRARAAWKTAAKGNGQ